MAPTPACFSVVSEDVSGPGDPENPAGLSAGTEPCTWHHLENGVSQVVYPAEYQAWLSASLRQGVLDYGSRSLEILTPRENFVFFKSPGIGRNEIPVEVIGGAEAVLSVRYDFQDFTVSRPFVFYLPSESGFHTLRVRCGDEEAGVAFSVEG
jgi:hypothetical protein